MMTKSYMKYHNFSSVNRFKAYHTESVPRIVLHKGLHQHVKLRKLLPHKVQFYSSHEGAPLLQPTAQRGRGQATARGMIQAKDCPLWTRSMRSLPPARVDFLFFPDLYQTLVRTPLKQSGPSISHPTTTGPLSRSQTGGIRV